MNMMSLKSCSKIGMMKAMNYCYLGTRRRKGCWF